MHLQKVIQYVLLVAGIFALIFGISELKLIRFELPTYAKIPGFIQKQPDLTKSFFMGLFLGNAGVACPNPATYVIFAYIAGVGNIFTGEVLQFFNGLGRFVPLLFFVILAILGINALQKVLKSK